MTDANDGFDREKCGEIEEGRGRLADYTKVSWGYRLVGMTYRIGNSQPEKSAIITENEDG